MKTLLFAGVAFASVLVQASTVTITVPAGVTNTLAQALSAGYATDETSAPVTAFHDVCDAADLVKAGPGRLDLPSLTNDLEHVFAGEVHVNEGVLRVTENGALGTTNKATFVKDGATLETYTTVAHYFVIKEPITIAGTGATGEGAFISRSTVNQGYHYTLMDGRTVWGGPLTLSADATIRAFSTTEFFSQNQQTHHTLDLNGHKLTMCGIGGRFRWTPMPHTGTIELGEDLRDVYFLTSNYHATPGELVVNVPNKTALLKFTYNDFLSVTWTFRLLTPALFQLETATPKGNWGGPFVLEAPLTVRGYQAAYGGPFEFKGPVSGSCGITADQKASLTFSADNTFQGGVTLAEGSTLTLNSAGALPANGGALKMTNTAVNLKSAIANYDLPTLDVTGTGLVTQAGGAWKGIVKRGDGLLEIEGDMAAPTIDLQKGSLSIGGKCAERTFYAGLNYGLDTDFYEWAKNASKTYPEGARFANNVYYNPNQASVTNKVVLDFSDLRTGRVRHPCGTYYAGYIMNNTDAPVTWRFASSCDTLAFLRINGTIVMTRQGVSTVEFCNVTLNPGANTIDYRIGSSDGTYAYSPNQITNCTTWTHGYGFAYCTTSLTSSNSADFAELVDPGDGSLLRVAVEGTAYWDQLKAEAEADAYAVGTLTASNGTALCIGKRNWCVATLSGVTKVTSVAERTDPVFTVTDAWVLDGEAVAAGAKLESEQSLTLSGVTLTVENPKALRNRTPYVIATSTKGITGVPTLAEGSDPRFALKLSDDGKSLILDVGANGLTILIR